MLENERAAAGSNVTYYPYVEPGGGAGRDLLQNWAEQAAMVVTDDYPAFFLPAMIEAAGRRLTVRLEAVDAAGIVPMRAAGRAFPTAHGFRRFIQKSLPAQLEEFPEANPLAIELPAPPAVPDSIAERWPRARPRLLSHSSALAGLPIDHEVAPLSQRGGSKQADRILRRFVDSSFASYARRRNHPDEDATSGLSAYLHFGHLSIHQVLAETIRREQWNVDRLSSETLGQRSGWWGMSHEAEAFLDQAITWRELGFNMCAHRPDYDAYETLPAWALDTLERHRDDPRPYLYSVDELESSATHDELWNAAQNQLVHEGRVHNYLRMLWGKKILEWSESPELALATMIHLNNKYAVDGRDPNSYSGIFWVLGRYDRAWGPERPIFGKVRYLSSENAARKLKLRGYLKRWSMQPALFDTRSFAR